MKIGFLGLAMGVGLLACGSDDSSSSDDGPGSAEGSGSDTSAGTFVGTSATSEVSTSTDGGVTGDSVGDSTGMVPEIECETTVESDLPGVTIEIDSPCALSLAQGQAGVPTSYTIDIMDALAGVDSGTMCYETPRGGLHVEWQVSGGTRRHCHCDVGLCPDYVPSPTMLVPGPTMGSFEWFAYDWNGPSDFDPPFGDPFEPGDYTIEVLATGFWDDGMQADVPFTVRATRPVVLVP